MDKIEQVGLDVHCGVVGNIQAFHVCAPGSIPGEALFMQYEIEYKAQVGIKIKKETQIKGKEGR